MTSIICWLNTDENEFFPGLWAVSDSLVCSGAEPLTDALPKLFPLPVNSYDISDSILKQNPNNLLNIGYGFAGSTLIGTAVKDILTMCLDNLSEISHIRNGEEVELSIDKRMPSIEDIAFLTGRIAKKYIMSMGYYHPKNAKCEIVIFGYCKKNKAYKIFVIRNNPDHPDNIIVDEKNLEESPYVILGDKKNEVLGMIKTKNELCLSTRYQTGRGPIIALQQIIKNELSTTIGGHLQICIASRLKSLTMYTSVLSEEGYFPFLGFSHEEIGLLGGFSINKGIGLKIFDDLLD
ncbi:hypothetical protein [Atlantibacter hermannii]|uniref:hypothetical protein n=1 Tax=Atlantibacter hermannii TaxID=565 RepID=UPI0028AD511E|nr:hypothetical protein [Atlantibacter hermannii]